MYSRHHFLGNLNGIETVSFYSHPQFPLVVHHTEMLKAEQADSPLLLPSYSGSEKPSIKMTRVTLLSVPNRMSSGGILKAFEIIKLSFGL